MYNYRPSKWVVRVQSWHPTHLNAPSAHGTKPAKLKRSDRDILSFCCLAAGVPKASHPRRVSLEIILAPGQLAADADSYWKSLLDALAQCRILVDDSRTWCVPGKIEFLRGNRPATVIFIENLDMPARKPSKEETALSKKIYRFVKSLRKNMSKLLYSR